MTPPPCPPLQARNSFGRFSIFPSQSIITTSNSVQDGLAAFDGNQEVLRRFGRVAATPLSSNGIYVGRSVCQSLCAPFCLYGHLSVCLYTYLSVCFLVCLYTCLGINFIRLIMSAVRRLAPLSLHDWLTHRLTEWLTDLTHRLTNWLSVWLINWLTDRPPGLTICLTEWVTVCLSD